MKFSIIIDIFFFLNDTPPTEISTLPQHAPLPISPPQGRPSESPRAGPARRIGKQHGAYKPSWKTLWCGKRTASPGDCTRTRGAARQFHSGTIEIGRAHV